MEIFNKKYLLNLSLLYFSLVIGFITQAQTPTVGLQFYDSNTFEGLTLFTPESNENVYLINNCGEKINEWNFTEKPGVTCYMLENGNLLRAGKDSIEIRDWNNNVVWTFLMSSIDLNQHHDIEPLPNGNILCVITDTYSNSEMIAAGRDPSIVDSSFKLDKIVELEPVGTNNANVVWEWKFFDHFIQDFDNTKPNYGVVMDHPELLDLNFDNGLNDDWTHVNSIDYNENLDQIIISARHLNEIYIIDHSTSTAEATAHTGGNSNAGGDFLWRWGNPQVYNQGTITDQKLFLQHDAKWVEPGYLDQGKISVFNNGGDGTDSFSSVHLISPNIINGVYEKENNKFEPLDFEWSWNGTILGNVVKESRKSGAHSLPNGNFIICESIKGRVSEITKTGTHLWTYKNPTGTQVYNQFEEPSAHGIFRAEKYPVEFIGFSAQDLTGQGLIEDVNSVSNDCLETLNIENDSHEPLLIVNPIENGIIQFNINVNSGTILINDLSGRLVFKQENFKGNYLYVKLPPAMYFVHIQINNKNVVKKIIFK